MPSSSRRDVPRSLDNASQIWQNRTDLVKQEQAAASAAADAKTARLKALRLEKEAQEAEAARLVVTKAPSKPGKRGGLFLQQFSIRHRTEYLYHQPVRLGPHRLMLRPRESHELRLISSEITTSPPSTLTWAQDVFGNAIATAQFEEPAKSLVIESNVILELNSAAWPVF